jgi:hypothetical protein
MIRLLALTGCAFLLGACATPSLESSHGSCCLSNPTAALSDLITESAHQLSQFYKSYSIEWDRTAYTARAVKRFKCGGSPCDRHALSTKESMSLFTTLEDVCEALVGPIKQIPPFICTSLMMSRLVAGFVIESMSDAKEVLSHEEQR